MKILANRHVGLIVNQFELMTKFYEGLGFQIKTCEIEEGHFVQTLLNDPKAKLKTAKLFIDQGSGTELKDCFCLEIMEVLSIKRSTEEINSKLNLNKRNSYRLGLFDLAFTVENINEIIEYIKMNGGHLISSRPIKAPSIHFNQHCMLMLKIPKKMYCI